MRISTTFSIERGEDVIELTLVGDFMPGHPGRTYGPPEDCFPPEEAEAEVDDILFNGKSWDGKLTPEELKEATDALLDAGLSGAGSPDPDDYYDSKYDR